MAWNLVTGHGRKTPVLRPGRAPNRGFDLDGLSESQRGGGDHAPLGWEASAAPGLRVPTG